MYLGFLNERYPDYEIHIKADTSYNDAYYEEAEILNPHKSDNILIAFEENRDDYSELTFCFSYQHCHFDNLNPENIKELLEYTDAFLNESIAAIEFFRDEKSAFGGHIETQNLNSLSVSLFSDKFGYKDEHFSGLTIKIRSWSGKYDMNLKVVNSLGKLYLEKGGE